MQEPNIDLGTLMNIMDPNKYLLGSTSWYLESRIYLGNSEFGLGGPFINFGKASNQYVDPQLIWYIHKSILRSKD